MSQHLNLDVEEIVYAEWKHSEVYRKTSSDLQTELNIVKIL